MAKQFTEVAPVTPMDKALARTLTDRVRIRMKIIDVAVGEAQGDLLQLFQSKAYKLLGYTNWSDFCRQEWGIKSTYGYRIVEAHRVRKLLETAGVAAADMPKTTSQAAALKGAGDEPEDVKQAWEDAQENASEDQPPASAIKEAVEEATSPAYDEEEPFEPDSNTEEAGLSIPDGKEITKALSLLKDLETKCIQLCASESGTYVHYPTLQADLGNLKRNIKGGKPYAECGYCAGKGCKGCKGMGWVNKDTWDLTAEELKD